MLLVGPDTEFGASAAAFLGAKVSHHMNSTAASLARLEDASFDAVVLSEGSEADRRWIPMPRQDHGARSSMFAECARLLQSGGALLLIIQASSASPLSLCLEQLRQAGFRVTGSWSLHPATRAWKRVVPHVLPVSVHGRQEWRSLAAEWGAFITRRSTPTYLIRAMREGAAERGGLSVLDEVLAQQGGTASEVLVTCQPYSGSVVCAHGTSFIKLPLNSTVRAQNRAVCELFRELEDRPVAKHLPLPIHHREAGGIEYFVTRRIEYRKTRRLPDRVELDGILRKLSAGAEMLPLKQTDFWTRVFSRPLFEAMEGLGAGPALAYLEALGNRELPCGLVHGDLHLNNILDRRGELILIDWDQFERRSPRFLDVVDLASNLVRAKPPVRIRDWSLDPIRIGASGVSPAPFASLLTAEGGALLPNERLLLFLLHRTSWRCIHNPRLIEQDRERFRRSLHDCLADLERAAPRI